MTNGWQQWIGRKGDVVPGPYPVSIATIGYLAEALEDERLAGQVASGGVFAAPRSFVTITSRVPNWRPKHVTGPESFMQAMLVPLPADSGVNLGVDQYYFAPLMPGDTLSSQSTITEIIPKRMRLGDGFIITENIDHINQKGVVVARTVNTLFRFLKGSADSDQPAKPQAASEARAAPKPAFRPPSDFPSITMPVTMTRLAIGAGAVRDFSPLHHDIDLAREAGHPTAFFSYSYQMALIVRALGEWFDGDDCVRRLKLSMKSPIYLGKTCACTGVRQATHPNSEAGIDTIEVMLSTEDGPSTSGIAEIRTEAAR